MPIYDFACDNDGCGEQFERILLIAEREIPQPCPTCQGPTHRVYQPDGYVPAKFAPVVVFKAADGTFRYPGSTEAPTPAGCTRLELRTLPEIDAFTRSVNHEERRKVEEAVEHEQRWIAAIEERHRPDLRQAMQSMTPAQRAFAQLAIDRNNARRPRSFDPNFHLDVREFDSTNREAYRDDRTGWRGRKD